MRTLAQEVLMNAITVDNETVYTRNVRFQRATGDCSIFISSTAGSITVNQQCSYNGEDFYDPIDPSGNALGEVLTVQTVTAGVWVAVTPVLAPYTRFKVVENNVAATVVTLRIIFQEQS